MRNKTKYNKFCNITKELIRIRRYSFPFLSKDFSQEELFYLDLLEACPTNLIFRNKDLVRKIKSLDAYVRLSKGELLVRSLKGLRNILHEQS